METGKQSGASHLFLLRTWTAESEQDSGVWARVQHIITGEARTFLAGPDLRQVLLELLAAPHPQPQLHPEGTEEG